MTDATRDGAPSLCVDGDRASRTLLWILTAAVAFTAANLYYYQPLLPALQADLKLDDSVLGLVPFGTQVGYALAILFLSPLGDLYPRRQLIGGLSLLLVVALVLQATAGNGEILVLGALLMGLGANITQQIIPLAASLSSPEQRGRVIGTIMSGLTAGILVSRVLAGGVAEQLGWRAVYWFAAGAALLWGVVLWRSLPQEASRARDLRYPSLILSMVGLFRRHRLLRVSALTGGLWFAAFNAVWASLALHVTGEPLGLDLQQAGMFGVAGMAGIVGARLAGQWVERLGAWRVMLLALLVLLVGVACLWGLSHSVVGLAVGVVLLDLGVFAAQIPNQVRVFAIAPEARSRLNAVYMLFYYLGASLGAVAGVRLMAAFGWQGVMALVAGLSALALVVHLANRDRQSPAS